MIGYLVVGLCLVVFVVPFVLYYFVLKLLVGRKDLP